MKRVLAPSLFITYPPSPFSFKKGLFLYFLPFLTLDKIKVGGDSCSPQHCLRNKNKSQFTELHTVFVSALKYQCHFRIYFSEIYQILAWRCNFGLKLSLIEVAHVERVL